MTAVRELKSAFVERYYPGIEEAIAAGADVNAPGLRTKYGSPPLYILAAHPRDHLGVEIAELLLQHGADVDATTPDGETALHAATRALGNERIRIRDGAGTPQDLEEPQTMIRLLLSYGADPLAKNKEGRTAREPNHYTPPEASEFVDTAVKTIRAKKLATVAVGKPNVPHDLIRGPIAEYLGLKAPKKAGRKTRARKTKRRITRRR